MKHLIFIYNKLKPLWFSAFIVFMIACYVADYTAMQGLKFIEVYYPDLFNHGMINYNTLWAILKIFPLFITMFFIYGNFKYFKTDKKIKGTMPKGWGKKD